MPWIAATTGLVEQSNAASTSTSHGGWIGLLHLGRGKGAAHVYFSDLTQDYIRINAEYTT